MSVDNAKSLIFRESFDIQMTRCYIRLLPEVPFVMFYEESGVEYWMTQFFDSNGTETITIIDNQQFYDSESIAKFMNPLLISTPAESVSCRSLFMLSSSSPSLPLHTLLQENLPTSFLAVLSSYPCSDEVPSTDSFQPPIKAQCEILLRYSLQSFSSLLLESDRLNDELNVILANFQALTENSWECLDESLFTTPLDYADSIYQAVLRCSTTEQALATARDFLYAIPTLKDPPHIAEGLHSPLTDIVLKGLEIIRIVLAGDTPLTSIRMQEWCSEVDTVSNLLEIVLEHGLRSITVRLVRELTSRNLPISSLPMIDSSQQTLKNVDLWVSSIRRCLRLFGFYCLLEVSVRLVILNHI